MIRHADMLHYPGGPQLPAPPATDAYCRFGLRRACLRAGDNNRRSFGGCIVTIDAMGTQANIAQAIRARGANYILSAKDNQPKLADSIRDFFAIFKAGPAKTPHDFAETEEKDHGRIEVRRCFAFDQLDCLHKPERWPGLASFIVIESERMIKGKTSIEQRLYISSLAPDATKISAAIRSHWAVENRLHWCMDVVFVRRPDACPHRPCRSQSRRLEAYHPEPHQP